MTKEIKYQIDLPTARFSLLKVTGRVLCSSCGNVLALNNQGAFLLKVVVSLVNIPDHAMVLRCGKCHNYTEMNYDKNCDGFVTGLLVV